MNDTKTEGFLFCFYKIGIILHKLFQLFSLNIDCFINIFPCQMLFKLVICSGCVSPIVTNILCLTIVMKCRSLEVNLAYIVGRQHCRVGDILRALPDRDSVIYQLCDLGQLVNPYERLRFRN